MHRELGHYNTAFTAHLDHLSWVICRAADVTRYLCFGPDDRPLEGSSSQDSSHQQRGSRPETTWYKGHGRRLTPEQWEMNATCGVEREGGGLGESWELVGAGEGKGDEDWRLLQYEGGELGWCDQGGITTRTVCGEGEGEAGLEGEAAWEEVYVVPFFDWYGDEDDEFVTPAIWGAGCGCKLCMEVPVWVESPAWEKKGKQKQAEADVSAAARQTKKERGSKSHQEEESWTTEDESSSSVE